MADQATAVTAELDNFVAASEFSTPHFENDTCGQAAFRMIQHAKDSASLTGDTMYQLRADMAAHGFKVQGGTVMSDLVKYFSSVQGLDVVEANAYGSTWDGAGGIHETCLAHAGRDGVVLEVEIADALTGNEANVNRHYIALGGIHPVKGYLVGNGDDVLALAGAPGGSGHGRVIPCRWMDQNVLAAARPSACAVIRGLSYTTDLSAGAIAAPQMVLDTNGNPTILPAGPIVEADPAPAAPAPTADDPASSSSSAGELGEQPSDASGVSHDPTQETAAGPSPIRSLDLEAEPERGAEPGAMHITTVSNCNVI